MWGFLAIDYVSFKTSSPPGHFDPMIIACFLQLGYWASRDRAPSTKKKKKDKFMVVLSADVLKQSVNWKKKNQCTCRYETLVCTADFKYETVLAILKHNPIL